MKSCYNKLKYLSIVDLYLRFIEHMTHSTFSTNPTDHVLLRLPREDLDLITQLVLESGSLKGLAKNYSVSYPTIRNRLNRVIARLRDVVDGRPPDPLNDLLANLVERGELAGHQARRIIETARTSTNTHPHPNTPPHPPHSQENS